MKAERRHQLKVNTLDQALANLPKTGWRYATTATTVVLAGILIFSLVRYRMAAGAQRAARATDNLAVAREEIEEIRRMSTMAVDPSQPAELFKDVSSRLDSVLADVGDSHPQLEAEALLARGDLDWNMAVAAGSSTQPSVDTPAPADLIQSAQTAWQQVISAHPDQLFAATTAHFGLAAAAENRQDWDEARKQYQTVIDDPRASDVFKKLATGMQASVGELAQSPLIAPPATQK
jgi:hypothetical protein